MRYEIIITCTQTEEVITGKEWAVIDSKEVERETSIYDSGKEPKTRIKEIHGYTPEVVKKQSVTREILKQNVDSLDLPAVIRAINNL